MHFNTTEMYCENTKNSLNAVVTFVHVFFKTWTKTTIRICVVS